VSLPSFIKISISRTYWIGSVSFKIFYFDVDHAVQVHDRIIEKSGGMASINNPGQLESSLTHLQNDDYYPEFVDKLTYLIFALVKFHVFSDGNKSWTVQSSL
jgi:death on curing protein